MNATRHAAIFLLITTVFSFIYPMDPFGSFTYSERMRAEHQLNDLISQVKDGGLQPDCFLDYTGIKLSLPHIAGLLCSPDKLWLLYILHAPFNIRAVDCDPQSTPKGLLKTLHDRLTQEFQDCDVTNVRLLPLLEKIDRVQKTLDQFSLIESASKSVLFDMLPEGFCLHSDDLSEIGLQNVE